MGLLKGPKQSIPVLASQIRQSSDNYSAFLKYTDKIKIYYKAVVLVARPGKISKIFEA